MIEKEMEDLIAEHPDSFFPRNEFTLIGRQGSFSGVGRYDLLFKDEHDYNILMELKAVSAKYQDAHQLAKYKDAFTEKGIDKILLWLVATQIPKSVRDFLDHIGIEYTEIHEIEYRKVATLFKYKFKSEESNSSDNLDITLSNQVDHFEQSLVKGKISKYDGKKIQLKNTFPAAFDFLSYVDNNHSTGFRFGKSVNVHLYYNDGFYAYIKLNHSSLSFSPFPNLKIKGDKKDKARLLFDQPLTSLIESLDGFKNQWAIRNANEFEIKNGAPNEFFNKFLELIKNVHK